MKCKNCETELTKDTERDCLVCLRCHPIDDNPAPTPAKKENIRVDVPWTDERILKLVRPLIEEICQDMIQEFYVPRSESADSADTVVIDEEWRAKAKRLGVSLAKKTGGARKKVDVLTEIASLEGQNELVVTPETE
jgi:hypothetical protein